jgi:hypothetical protein
MVRRMSSPYPRACSTLERSVANSEMSLPGANALGPRAANHDAAHRIVGRELEEDVAQAVSTSGA